MSTEPSTARQIAENVVLRAAHQILTVVGVPILVSVTTWSLNTLDKMSDQLTAANERLAVVETLKPRIQRLENMADIRGGVAALEDVRRVERDVQRLDGRVVALERIFTP